MTVAALVGNPHAASRTRSVAEDLVRQLAARYGLETGDTIDLADHGAALFTFPEPTIDALTDRVAATEILVVASPTYKASYTGLLKAFLDRYPTRGLAGVTAIPLFTVGSPAHALAVDVTLRPLLVELGASVPTSGIAFPVGEFPDRAEILASWIEQESAVLDRLLTR